MSKLSVTIEEYSYEIELSLVAQPGGEITVLVDGRPVTVVLPDLDLPVDEMEWLLIDGRPYEVGVDPDLR